MGMGIGMFTRARVRELAAREFKSILLSAAGLLAGFLVTLHSAAAANSAPTISGSPDTSASVGQSYSFTPAANDADGDTLHFVMMNRPSWASFSYGTGGLYGTPTTTGTWSDIAIFVTDGTVTKALPKFSITVKAATSSTGNTSSSATGGNTAPKISGTPPSSVSVGGSYSFEPNASDVDGDTLHFVITNRPSWASFSYGTGALYGKPPSAGTWSNIGIYVSDGTVTTSLPKFSITATTGPTGNSAPQISGSPPTSVAVGSNYSFEPNASDADGDKLSFVIMNRPSWASFSYSSGGLYGKPSQTGTWSNIIIFASDGKATTKLAPFSITVGGSGSSNSAPKISGTPSTSVTAGNAYSFTPSASDANGDPLSFSISNKPSWASFSTANGKLWGTPSSSQVGTYSNISIKVSDGSAAASLPAFAINVAAISNGSATLSWVPPARNTDGTSLTNLAGYRIYYGTSSGSLNQTVEIKNASISTYIVENLSPATYYFAVKAFNSSGVESGLSNVASKKVY